MNRVGDSTHGIEASQDHDDKEKREERREEREGIREKTEDRPQEAARGPQMRPPEIPPEGPTLFYAIPPPDGRRDLGPRASKRVLPKDTFAFPGDSFG